MDSTETTETTETTDNAANDAPAEPKERSIDEIRDSAVPKIAAKMSGKDAETEQPKAETDTEEPQVDWDDLAERSIAVGMSDEDLEKYTDPKALEEALKD